MIRRRKYRYISALLLLGGVLVMWLAPQSLAGMVLLVAGIALEALSHRLGSANTDKEDHTDALER